VFRRGAKTISAGAREGIITLLGNLEELMKKSKWFAGDEISIADLSLLANVATIKVVKN
jgi:glutathione S-transferase